MNIPGRYADYIDPGVSGQYGETFVDLNELAVEFVDVDRIRAGVEGRAKPLLAFPQGIVGPFALFDFGDQLGV